MTILEALNWGRDKIKKTLPEKQTDRHNPMLDAQVLLAHCLSKPTSFLFAHFDENIPAAVSDRYIRMIERRALHEPVAHITGKKAFFGREFNVNTFAMTPRPETEQLVERAQEHVDKNGTLLDVGTGSGAIAVTIAAETDAQAIAVDVDSRALALANKNARQHGVARAVSFLQGDLLEPVIEKNIRFPAAASVVITANLPYVPAARWENLDPDIRCYEPKHAIVSGVDGLEHYDRLFAQIVDERDRFPDKLRVYIEIDSTHVQTAPALVRNHLPQADIAVHEDLAGSARVMEIKA